MAEPDPLDPDPAPQNTPVSAPNKEGFLASLMSEKGNHFWTMIGRLFTLGVVLLVVLGLAVVIIVALIRDEISLTSINDTGFMRGFITILLLIVMLVMVITLVLNLVFSGSK